MCNQNYIPINDLRLSEHFMLSEFERSATAEKFHIDNSVPSQYIPTLQQLCKEVLEPLRRYAGGPVAISSGYRCNQLNVKVGGAYASQRTLAKLLTFAYHSRTSRPGMTINGIPILRLPASGSTGLSTIATLTN